LKYLKHICQPSLPLLESQIIWLDESLKQQGGGIKSIHLFLYEIYDGQQTIYLKVNLMDNEFYLFYGEDDVKRCENFYEIRNLLLI
jgi:hypothetical protein